jgi:transcriptional regulator with XRE-family HTH domain
MLELQTSVPANASAVLRAIGQALRAKRKRLQVSSIAAAEAAGMSRVTLYRLEKGEASVSVGAYLQAAHALGMTLQLLDLDQPATLTQADHCAIPAQIRLSDFPQLKQLAWQVQGTDVLSPREAFSIYERNARHLDASAMAPHEHQLWIALQRVWGDAGRV